MYGTAFGYFLRQFLLLFSQEVCEYLLQLIFGNLVSDPYGISRRGVYFKKEGLFCMEYEEYVVSDDGMEFGGGGGGVHGELKGLKHLKCEEQSFQRSDL